MKKQKINIRIMILTAALLMAMLVYSARLVDMQIVNRQTYIDQANAISVREAVVKAPRGEILDRYGRPLAQNRAGYSVVLDQTKLPRNKTNAIIKALTEMLAESGETWRDKLPVSESAPFSFTSPDEDEINALRRHLQVNNYASAQNCFDTMLERYAIGGMPADRQRIIAGIRYTMEVDAFSYENTYTYAEDVSSETAQRVMERGFEFPGVDIEYAFFRDYAASDIAPHVIGNVKPIYAENWQTYKEKGYQLSDKVGDSGIEKAMEDYLKGIDGKRQVTVEGNGDISSVTTIEPVSGNTVILSIDKDLQEVAQASLQKYIREIAVKNPACKSGAIVVMKVETGEILAAATYPSYSKTDDMEKLLKNPDRPLFDRSLNGAYPPGSAFKPATALAGLQSGAITPSTRINCVKKYTFYPDYQPSCLHGDGLTNVVKALSVSCNYFFFETSRLTTIETMNQTCRALGLGVATGIELPEYQGILAGPEERKAAGLIWNPGDTIQAGIGQSDNAFTPLQLAQYTATIANGGTRYAARFVKEIKSYSLESTVVGNVPRRLNATGIDEAYFDVVKEGMLRVTDDTTGTAHSIFRNYGIRIGGKTGTAEVANGPDNGIFIAFAPYEKPEIALAIVIEHGESGRGVSSIARAILDQYFFPKVSVEEVEPVGVLLK